MRGDLWRLAVDDIVADTRAAYERFGGELIERPGVIGIVNSRIPRDCWIYEPDVELDDLLRQLAASSPRPQVNLVAAHSGHALVEAAGWVVDEHTTQMVLPTADALVGVDAPPGVRIEPVIVPNGIDELHAAMDAGFEAKPGSAVGWLPREVIVTYQIGLFVARQPTGDVIGTAGWRRRARGAQLFAISVHPDHRRLGLGGALTTVAAEAALASGLDFVQLQATDAGYHVYERAGFGRAGGWTFYRPDDAGAATG